MSYTPYPAHKEIGTDAGGRARVANITTLFDGKTLNSDNATLWQNVGTGTTTFNTNKVNLSATTGQYMIRRGRHIIPYFSGKSQIIEVTFDGFSTVSGATKRVGYFSSSATAPHTANFDGFFIESSDGIVALKVFRLGTEVISIPISSWDNYSYFQNYNWDNFTVVLFDFMWLGGTELRMFIKTEEGFVLAHTYKHASTTNNTFISSPNQSIRYETIGVTTTSTLNAICSHIGTEGAIPDAGKPTVLFNKTAIAANAVGTIYALKGVKKLASERDIAVAVTSISVSNTTTADAGMLLLIVNPTLSAPLTYVNIGRVSEGTATTQTVTANTGRVIAAVPAGTTGTASGINDTILAQVAMSITNASDEIVLAYMSTSATQSVFGAMTIKEY